LPILSLPKTLKGGGGCPTQELTEYNPLRKENYYNLKARREDLEERESINSFSREKRACLHSSRNVLGEKIETPRSVGTLEGGKTRPKVVLSKPWPKTKKKKKKKTQKKRKRQSYTQE